MENCPLKPVLRHQRDLQVGMIVTREQNMTALTGQDRWGGGMAKPSDISLDFSKKPVTNFRQNRNLRS